MANRLSDVDPTQLTPPPLPVAPDPQSAAPVSGNNRLTGADLPPPPPPPPPPDEPAKPDPNAYQPPSWLPGAGVMHKISDLFDNAFTASGANYATAKAGNLARSYGIPNTTPDVGALRATTAQNRQDVGPVASTAADIAGYAMGPGKVLGPLAGKAAPYIGRYGAAALEGGVTNTLNSINSQIGSKQGIDPYAVAKDTGVGMGAGIVGQGIGDAVSAVARPIADYVSGKSGRGGELWNWRTRAAQGEDLTPDIRNYQRFAPPGGPEQAALSDLQSALNQSTNPGAVARAAKIAATGIGGWTGFSHLNSALETLGGVGLGTYLGDKFVNPLARGINTIDRNINVGQAFDRAYPALTYQPASTSNTSGWADALRKAFIGSAPDLSNNRP